MAATYPADTFQEGVDLTIEASNQLAQVVRGDANTEVTVADGSIIPSIRKAQADSMNFKEPELWVTGQTETDYLQLKKYINPTTRKESWWFAKGAMVSNPIAMGTSPFGDDNWTLYTPEDLFISGKAEYESVYQALKGKAAEAGYNLVRGSFEEGGTLTNTNDVLWYQSNGKYYNWYNGSAKTVVAGSTPATSGGIGAGAWVDRTDVTLRDELAGKNGTGLVNGGKWKSWADIKEYGATCDGVTNDATALINALTEQDLPVHLSNSYLLFAAEQVSTLIENIDRIYPSELTKFYIPAGESSITKCVNVSSAYAVNIDISAPQPAAVTCLSVSCDSGSAGAYQVTYTLTDTSGFTVGKYAIISSATGSDKNCRAIEGCFKITAKTPTTITVLHTLYASWPSFALTSATVTPINTVLRWPDNVVGMRVFSTLRAMRNLVIAGSYDINSNTPADSACDGLQVGAAPNTPETGLNESEQINAGAMWAQNIGIVEWRGNGLQVKGGKFYGVNASFCSNGWRGAQAASSGYALVKYSSSCGNGASGYEAEAGGIVEASKSSACGNYQQGVYAIGLAQVDFTFGVAVANGTHGIDARNGGHIQADAAVTRLNGGYGINSAAGKIIFGSNAVASENTTYDISLDEAGVVDASGALDTGVVSANDSKGVILILPTGAKYYPQSKVLLKSSTTQAGFQVSTSSIGDITYSYSVDGVTYTPREVKKENGTSYPSVDAATDFGRSANRYRYGFFSGGVLTTSDERMKDMSELSESLRLIGAELKSLIQQYVFKNSADTNTHIGVSAQKVCSVFTKYGLDAVSFGLVDHVEWGDEFDDDGNKTLEAGDRYSVNYAELAMLIISGM